MSFSLGLIESFIFITLSLVHFNWVFGGTWGFDAALPTNENEKRVLNPRKIDSLVVALGLLVFGLYYLIKIRLLLFYMPNWILQYGGWFIAVVFIARAIGDFKYVGFFKKIKITNFAKYDSSYYSPLCLFVGITAVILQIL
jgi:hypothetical protein